jgi:hypothetical protein
MAWIGNEKGAIKSMHNKSAEKIGAMKRRVWRDNVVKGFRMMVFEVRVQDLVIVVVLVLGILVRLLLWRAIFCLRGSR